MRKKSLKCPYCNKRLAPTLKSDEFFCKNCNQFIMFEDWVETRESQQTPTWEQKEKTKHIRFIRSAIILLCAFAISMGVSVGNRFRSNSEERKLEQTVDLILIDIENEDFIAARSKANSLHYTIDDSSDKEYKWDSIRWQMLEDIDKAEEESKKSDKPSILDWFHKDTDDSEDSSTGFTNQP